MAFVTPLVTGALLAIFTIILARLEKTRSDKIEAELKDFRGEVRTEFAQIRTEMAVMRSDLTRVALAFGTQPRPEAG